MMIGLIAPGTMDRDNSIPVGVTLQVRIEFAHPMKNCFTIVHCVDAVLYIWHLANESYDASKSAEC